MRKVNLNDKLKLGLTSEEEEEKDIYLWALMFTAWVALMFMANLMLQKDIRENSARSEFPSNSLSDPF